jgi:hypothetical protein
VGGRKDRYHWCHDDLEQSLEPRCALHKAAGISMQHSCELTFPGIHGVILTPASLVLLLAAVLGKI